MLKRLDFSVHLDARGYSFSVVYPIRLLGQDCMLCIAVVKKEKKNQSSLVVIGSVAFEAAPAFMQLGLYQL